MNIRQLIRYSLVLCFLLFLFACGNEIEADSGLEEKETNDSISIDTIPAVNSLETIWNDMALAHEANPSGLPSNSDWYNQPRLAWGNNPPSDWTAMIPWGQVYNKKGTSSPENVRFQIRNMQAWYLSKTDSSWHQWIVTSNIGGANYAEDFADDKNIPADIRKESKVNGGGISSTLQKGYNFHFWSADGRVDMDPSDIRGVWASCECRLIVGDTTLADNRENSELIFSAGADYWQSKSAQWDQWKTNGDIGIGRFRYITSDWQAFNMHSLSKQDFDNFPPPWEVNLIKE